MNNILLLLTACLVSAEPIELTNELFHEKVVNKNDREVRDGNPWLIRFYAPWCGVCKKTHQDWVNYSNEIAI